MKATIIQNSAYGAAGLVQEFITAKGWTARQTLLPADLIHRDLRTVVDDVVILLGSPRGTYETHVQWIARELALVRRLVAEEVPLFGICFGAQMIATTLGGSSTPMDHRYRGWMPNHEVVSEVWRGPWLRWHGDVIALPSEAEIFSADGDVVQAFRRGTAVGVQFHPEVSADLLRAWLEERGTGDGSGRAELETAIAYADANGPAIRRRAFDLFEHVFEMIRS